MLHWLHALHVRHEAALTAGGKARGGSTERRQQSVVLHWLHALHMRHEAALTPV